MESGAGLRGDGEGRIEGPESETSRPGPRSPGELFFAFSRLALQGFGGVLPVAHRELVERRAWVSPEQFVELLAIGQVLPGPNIINMSIILGDRWFGLRGVLAALGGLMAFPLLIVLGLASLYRGFAEYPAVAGALRGMGIVASGLVIATALKLVKTLAKSPFGLAGALALALLSFVLVGLLRWPLVPLVLGLGPLLMGFALWRLSRILPGGRA